MQYSKEQRQIANRVDLYEFLLKKHPDLCKKEGSRYLRFRNDNSVIVGKGKSGYKDCAIGKGGSNIDFLTNFLGYSLVDAIIALSGGEASGSVTVKPNPEIFSPADFTIPEPVDGPYRNLYAYLSNRGISHETIQMLIEQKLLYQEKAHNNMVFLNKAKNWGETRGTNTYADRRCRLEKNCGDYSGGEHMWCARMDACERYKKSSYHGVLGGSKSDGFWFFQVGSEKSKNVFVCEAAIDAISLYEIRRRTGERDDDVYVSLGGVGKYAPIDFLLRHYHVILAVDNDKGGQATRDRYSDVPAIIPEHKDWNEDLLAMVAL